MLARRLRCGLQREIDQLARDWQRADRAAPLFRDLQRHTVAASAFRQQLAAAQEEVRRLRGELAADRGSEP